MTMFWRGHYCYSCYRHHEWLTFRRGMAAMVILAFLVIGVLDYPTRAHQLHKPQPASSSAEASHRTRHHHQPGHVTDRQSKPRPKPATLPRPVRHARPVNRRRHRGLAGTTSVATASQGLRWTSFHGIELPTSATAGPHHTRGGLA